MRGYRARGRLRAPFGSRRLAGRRSSLALAASPGSGLAGLGGARLKDLTDVALVMDSYDYGQVEGAHLVLVHLLSRMVVQAAAEWPRETDVAVGSAGLASRAGSVAGVREAREAAG